MSGYWEALNILNERLSIPELDVLPMLMQMSNSNSDEPIMSLSPEQRQGLEQAAGHIWNIVRNERPTDNPSVLLWLLSFIPKRIADRKGWSERLPLIDSLLSTLNPQQAALLPDWMFTRWKLMAASETAYVDIPELGGSLVRTDKSKTWHLLVDGKIVCSVYLHVLSRRRISTDVVLDMQDGKVIARVLFIRTPIRNLTVRLHPTEPELLGEPQIEDL